MCLKCVFDVGVCMFCSFMLVWALVFWTDLGKGLNMGGVLKCVWVSTGQPTWKNFQFESPR